MKKQIGRGKFQKFIHQWSWTILLLFCMIGLAYPAIGLIALVCMLAPVLVAFFKGRMWCGNFCPRGSFNDILLSKISRKGRIPQVMTTTWFRNLFLIVLMSAFAIQIFFVWGSLTAIGLVFVRMILITTILTIILGTLYRQRTWCRICPMGTMAHYAARMANAKSGMKQVTFDKDLCISCKVCSKSCPMDIDILSCKKQGKVEHADCIKCSTCIRKCPKKSLHIA